MKAFPQRTIPPTESTRPDHGTHRVTILYQDFPTGLLAKNFSDQLAALLGLDAAQRPACWRLELIDLPEVADVVARDVTASEFIVLALRGDCRFSMEFRTWLETCLIAAAEMGSMLLVLFEPAPFHAAGEDCTAGYLRNVALDAGLPFFALSSKNAAFPVGPCSPLAARRCGTSFPVTATAA